MGGFIKSDLTNGDDYVLLAGGGHSALKTVNGSSIFGSGNISVSTGTGTVSVVDKGATIGTTSTVIATIGGTDVTAKIGSYASSSHNHSGVYAPNSHTHAWDDISAGDNDNGNFNITAGNLWIGSDSSSTERQVGVRASAGGIYLFSLGSSSGNKGIYLSPHGTDTEGKSVFTVDTNNNITFYGDLDWSYITNKPTIPSDTNTWRAIQVNGSLKMGTGTDTGTVNFAGGANVTLDWDSSSKTITINSSGGSSSSITTKSKSFVGSSTTTLKILFYLNPSDSSAITEVHYNNNLYVNNTGVYYSSDKILKENIERYTTQLLENPVKKFTWKNGDDSINVGFIAQEVEKWCPEAVGLSEDGTKTVNYKTALTAMCSVMYDRIARLEKQVASLIALTSSLKVLEVTC